MSESWEFFRKAAGITLIAIVGILVVKMISSAIIAPLGLSGVNNAIQSV